MRKFSYISSIHVVKTTIITKEIIRGVWEEEEEEKKRRRRSMRNEDEGHKNECLLITLKKENKMLKAI